MFDKRFVYFEWDDVLEGKEVFIGDTYPELRERVNHNNTSFRCAVEKHIGNYPFLCGGDICYAFVYYDPNYECKVAYAQGKTIQFKSHYNHEWEYCNNPAWVSNYEYRVKPEDEHKLVLASNGCLSLDTENVTCVLYTGTKEQCLKYATDVMCGRCVNFKTCSPDGSCRGFRELKVVKKRRKTNRELAQWVAQGNGQVKHRDGNFAYNTYEAYDMRNDDKPCPFYWLVRGWDETEWHEPLVEEAGND